MIWKEKKIVCVNIMMYLNKGSIIWFTGVFIWFPTIMVCVVYDKGWGAFACFIVSVVYIITGCVLE